MPVYDQRYEDQPVEYVNIVLKIVSPYEENGVSMNPPRFGRVELNHKQLGFLPVYLNYEDAVRDYPNVPIHQIRVPIEN